MTDIEAVKEIYAAINRNDISGVIQFFDQDVERVEPPGFPMSGTYRGLAEIQKHFISARASWAEGSCQPEKIIPAGDKIVVFVYVRVRKKDAADWTEGRIADGFVFRNGKVILMRTFLKREEALGWAEVDE